MAKMTIRNEMLYRLYGVLGVVVLVAAAIFGKAIQIAVVDGEKWRERGKSKYVQFRTIEADRGNILAADGSLLATSLPYFDLAFDPNSSGMTPTDFNNNIDSLAYCLATQVDPSYTPGGYRDYLVQKREEGSQYVMLKRNVSFAEMLKIRKFPLFNLGQFRGGMIVMPKYRRERPFGLLAHRTIGYVREGIKPVGLEGYFNDVLSGEEGRQLMMRVEEDVWKPIEDLAKIEPKSGLDVRTTIDVDIQDITEEALYMAVDQHEADHGVAIVMEVETGAIKAIANLGRTRNGELWETYNHAIGSAIEPGSTFKLATILALLESGAVDLQDSINLEQGRVDFYEEEMVDAVAHGLDSTTVQRAFELSSNVGMAKLVQQHFGEGQNAGAFIKLLKQFNLHVKTGIEIEGEAMPYLKEAYSQDDDWSGTTLPWMSTGYEVMLTPLQLLAFYNAVANDGMLMKPYLVSSFEQYGQLQERFPPTVVKRKIASRKSIEQAQFLLRRVVEEGTAKKLNTDEYAFSGKTGTAQLNYKRLKDRTRVGGYQASFVGYFPSEKPKYSCIVVINDPKRKGIYGGEVALPVFRRIADKIYATKLELQPPLNDVAQPLPVKQTLPDWDAGDREEIGYLLSSFGLPFEDLSETNMAMVRAEKDTLSIYNRPLPEDRIPNVTGMGLRDALYALENLGLKVEVRGYGKVIKQSIKPGTPLRGQTIYLRLN
jgi:cell division protein FtsI (penicillin-binding protein 3)